MPAKAEVPATSRNPGHVGIGTTPRMAPPTQMSWKRVSNRAKERPRFASGASRCTNESNACLAHAAPMPALSATMAEPGSEPIHVPAKDRKSVGEGKSLAVRVELGGRRSIKKKKIKSK